MRFTSGAPSSSSSSIPRHQELGDDPEQVISYYQSLEARLTMPGLQADFESWSPADFVSAASRLPGGLGTVVMRPRGR